MKRQCGMLMPISSLPSKYGIGCFSKEAYAFIDMLSETSQSLWQILPIGPTGYGDSPYQSFSTFAGNPYFIDLEQLIQEGLLEAKDCDSCDWGSDDTSVEYDKIYNNRFILLKKAYKNYPLKDDAAFWNFYKENYYWVHDYALFMAIKDSKDSKPWSQWEEPIRYKESDAVKHYENLLSDTLLYYVFIQYLFKKQWTRLKNYANEKSIQIIGDIPIYVSFDSVDVWAHPELFQLDQYHMPAAVSGCPPDAFAPEGQLWGNPLYNWNYHKKTNFQWWISRLKMQFELFDIVRIDHFRGFDAYYSIPFGDTTAVNGHWEKGIGLDFFNCIKKELGNVPIIAEDLGYVTDSVKQLLSQTGYPGMKVLQFAFDSREEGCYLPYSYPRNCVVYTGTHDNDTIMGWYDKFSDEDRNSARAYLNNYYTPADQVYWDYICCALASVADTCIIPVQDYLGLGSEGRINIPSVSSGNWKWRIRPNAFSQELKDKICLLTKIYGRC